jgi:16S rRNA (guanine(966)-N(2))-methyltransferase RsmD
MMNMRVIAGEYRRRTLVAPQGMETRPTSDRLRETLFNVLAPRLEGARFLDLYAGSGANGIEALSRGAAQVVMVEKAPPAVAAIRANLAALKVPGGFVVEARSVGSWLTAAGKKDAGGFDVVFLDPPYDAAGEYEATLGALGAGALLAPGAVVVAEHRRVRRGRPAVGSAPAEFADRYGRLERTRVLEQGDGALSFYAVVDSDSVVSAGSD